MKKILGEDIECPFCHSVFFKDDEVEIDERVGKLFIFCFGCGANLEVEQKDVRKIYM